MMNRERRRRYLDNEEQIEKDIEEIRKKIGLKGA